MRRVHLLAVTGSALLLAGAAAGSRSAAPASNRHTGFRVAASSCATKAPFALDSSRIGAARKLVPSGATQILLCRYDGPFGAPRAHVINRFRLVAGRMVGNQGQVRALASALNRLPRLAGSYGCAVQTGAIVAFFHYASGPANPVRVQEAGCETATNGHVIRSAVLNGSTVLQQLEALVHATPGSGSSHRGNAIIAGRIRLCGGPAPGRCFTSTIGGCTPHEGCADSDRVVAIGETGRVAAEAHLRASDARFRLSVRPGNYALELLADGRRVHDQLLQTKGCTVGARSKTRVVFTFDVP